VALVVAGTGGRSQPAERQPRLEPDGVREHKPAASRADFCVVAWVPSVQSSPDSASRATVTLEVTAVAR